jgi:hypothetical protein
VKTGSISRNIHGGERHSDIVVLREAMVFSRIMGKRKGVSNPISGQRFECTASPSGRNLWDKGVGVKGLRKQAVD